MNNFESLVAWQKAYKFTLLAYKVANTFPECERFGLCSQFKRAAVSVPANIAEGYKNSARQTSCASITSRKEALKNADAMFICRKTLGMLMLRFSTN